MTLIEPVLPTDDYVMDLLRATSFRPFGGHAWNVTGEVVGPSDQYEYGCIIITVENPFSRNSRDYDHWTDEDDGWTMIDGRSQSFVTFNELPPNGSVSDDVILKWAAMTVAYAGAHEALEWFVDEQNHPIFDPHEHFDVEVVM